MPETENVELWAPFQEHDWINEHKQTNLSSYGGELDRLRCF